MAKKTRSEGEPREVDWEDKAVHEAMENKQPLPDGIHLRSPYGKSQIDHGTMAMLDNDADTTGAGEPTTGGSATGDDGNTGSSAGGATTRGARD